MYNREYYDTKRAEFYSAFDKFTSEDTTAVTMVRTAQREQEAREAESYAENEYLEDFTRIADEMQIETVDDFENYLTVCLGGRLIDGVRALRKDNSAFFSSSNAVALAPKHTRTVISDRRSDGKVLWAEKSKPVITWNSADKYSVTDKTVCTPISEKKLVRMLKHQKAFPKYKKDPIKDRKVPVYSIISVLLCMAVLMLPVFLSVICNEVEVQNKEYDAYIKELNCDIKELENEVALKRDMQLINTLAREEYGMIDAELSDIKRVECSEDTFTLENTEPEKEKNVWVMLLSAIGIISED